MKTKLMVLISVLLLSTLLVSMPGCRVPTKKELKFTDIYHEPGPGGYTSKLPGIMVVTQKPSSPVYGIQVVGSINPTGEPGYPAQNAVEAIDYSRNFVVIAFYGWRGLSTLGISNFRIVRIQQTENTIFVTAHFEDQNAMSGDSAIVSTFDIVQVKRSELIKYGETTFILIDETGKEQARNTFTVTK